MKPSKWLSVLLATLAAALTGATALAWVRTHLLIDTSRLMGRSVR